VDASDAAATDRGAKPVDVVGILLLIVLAAVYAPLLRELLHRWEVDPYAGHGMFVPIYSGLLLWFERRHLAATPRTRSPAGGICVLAALALLWVGRLTDSIVLQGISLVVAVAGSVLWRFGAARLRAAAFPIAFLAFMLPLPKAVVDMVTLDAQNFHASFTSAALQLIGVPHLQRGIYIELPKATLVVVEGCNGLRFLMALVTLTAAFAQATQRSLGRKFLLTVLAVPIAVIANGFRVTALSLAAYRFGAHAVEGMTHHSIGKAIWALALGLVIVLGLLLRRGPRRDAIAARSAIADASRLDVSG